MKRIITTLVFALGFHFAFCCSCLPDREKDFFKNLNSGQTVVIAVYDSMSYEVEHLGASAQTGYFTVVQDFSLQGATGKTIVVIGRNGVNCNDNLDRFGFGDTLVLSLYNHYPWKGVSDTFSLVSCGTHYLQIKNGMAAGMSVSEVSLKVRGALTGLADQHSEAFVCVFPNPVTNKAEIRIPGEEIKKVVITDISGMEIANASGGLVEHAEINMENLKPGLYRVLIATNKKTYSRKISKI